MPSWQALSACREGIFRYFSNFQYPLRSEPMRSIKPASLSIFNLSGMVFRLHNLVDLFQNGAVDLILIQQIGVRLKISDSHIRAPLAHEEGSQRRAGQNLPGAGR